MTSCYRRDGIRFNRKFLVVKQACRKDTQFLTRGLENVKNEWTLVCLAWNVKRMAVLRP